MLKSTEVSAGFPQRSSAVMIFELAINYPGPTPIAGRTAGPADYAPRFAPWRAALILKTAVDFTP